MNRLYSPQQKRKFAVGSESLLAVLGMVALFQIILCFSAGSGPVEPVHPINSAIQAPALETNAPKVREAGIAPREKLSGFQSVTAHG